MSATFVYTLFISLIVFVVGLAVYGYYLRNRVSKIRINPINVIMGAVLLMSLWMFDLTTLGVSEKGLAVTSYGVSPGATRVPGWFVWGVCFMGMAIVAGYYYFYNEKKNRFGVKQFNRYLIYTLLLGLAVSLSGALYMLINGYSSTLFGIYAEGLYHSSLPLIIIPTLVLMVEIK
jgi:hypothetical protein